MDVDVPWNYSKKEKEYWENIGSILKIYLPFQI